MCDSHVNGRLNDTPGVGKEAGPVPDRTPMMRYPAAVTIRVRWAFLPVCGAETSHRVEHRIPSPDQIAAIRLLRQSGQSQWC